LGLNGVRGGHGARARFAPPFSAPAYSFSDFCIAGQVGYGRDTANSQLQTPAGNVLARWNGSPDEIVGGANPLIWIKLPQIGRYNYG
jgi:hypothetical protein